MSLLAPLLIRVLGPIVALACAGTLLAPMMGQSSTVYVNTDVVQLIGRQLWPTLLLIALAILFATAIWLPLAVLTALFVYDAGTTVAPVSVLAQALAPFWIAILGLLLFGMPSRLVPAAGGVSVGQVVLTAGALGI